MIDRMDLPQEKPPPTAEEIREHSKAVLSVLTRIVRMDLLAQVSSSAQDWEKRKQGKLAIKMARVLYKKYQLHCNENAEELQLTKDSVNMDSFYDIFEKVSWERGRMPAENKKRRRCTVQE